MMTGLEYTCIGAFFRYRIVGVWLALVVGTAFALGAFPGTARAARVVELARDGRPTVRDDPLVSLSAMTPAPGVADASVHQAPARVAVGRTVLVHLARLYRSHQIDRNVYRADRASFISALAEVKRLSRPRAAELKAVIWNLGAMAAGGKFIPSRLPALFLTLDRNRQWWRAGPLLSYGQRVEFAGSQLVWEYYPGQGIELQELGSFGKADWYCTAGPKHAAQCGAMLTELIPLAAERSGGLTWEYYFEFDGGAPPWTSAMSQGTALQTLADAFRSLGNSEYLQVARRALPLFSAAPPSGIAVRTRLGARYLQYSFAAARTEDVLNGFLQSLIGLHDYADVSGNATAGRLFAAGDAEARAEVPHFDTGAWSLFQPGEEDSLDYHKLVIGFLRQLCTITAAPVYCTTARHFELDLKTPPALQIFTARVPAKSSSTIRFDVSKLSRVGITVLDDGRTVFRTSAEFSHGSHGFVVPALARTGTYIVRLDATDLAGNYSQVSSNLYVAHQRPQ